jgi:hypothetical protein
MIAGASQPGAPVSVCPILIVSRLEVSMRVRGVGPDDIGVIELAELPPRCPQAPGGS